MIWDNILLSADGFTTEFKLLGTSETTPFVIRNVTGLSNPTRSFGFNKGLNGLVGQFAGNLPDQRQIILTLGVHGNSSVTVSDLRSQLYRYLDTIDNFVKLQVRTGNTEVVMTEGIISKIEAPMFVQDPVIQVTFECRFFPLTSTLGWENPTLTANKAVAEVTNKGMAPCYVWGEFKVRANVSALKIVETHSGRFIHIDTSLTGSPSTILSGNTIRFSTNPRSRYVQVVRTGGTVQSLLPAMTRTSEWFLAPVKDKVSVTIKTPADVDLPVDWTKIAHIPSWWGI